MSGSNLYCFGQRNYTGNDSTYANLGTGWKDVGVGESHSCGIHTDDTLSCWGSNNYGQLGDGGTKTSKVPVDIGSASDWIDITGGRFHTCGIRSVGGLNSLWCWGTNTSSQLGDGTTAQRENPTLISSDTDWLEVSAGGSITCGIKTNRSLSCWGGGYIGNGTTSGSTTPLQIGTDVDWLAISVGHGHTCGLRDGQLWCWGSNTNGQVGDGTTTASPSPVRIGTRTDWTTVYAAARFTCGTTSDDTLYCWGQGTSGQLGHGEAARWPPVVVP